MKNYDRFVLSTFSLVLDWRNKYNRWERWSIINFQSNISMNRNSLYTFCLVVLKQQKDDWFFIKETLIHCRHLWRRISFNRIKYRFKKMNFVVFLNSNNFWNWIRHDEFNSFANSQFEQSPFFTWGKIHTHLIFQGDWLFIYENKYSFMQVWSWIIRIVMIINFVWLLLATQLLAKSVEQKIINLIWRCLIFSRHYYVVFVMELFLRIR